jgi:hypothetical protein
MAAAYANPRHTTIEVGVGAVDIAQFDDVVTKLQRAVRAWDEKGLLAAWAQFIDPAESQPQWPRKSILDWLSDAVQAQMKVFDVKYRQVAPILKKNLVLVDFNGCRVSNACPIQFASRAPPPLDAASAGSKVLPDMSAELEPAFAKDCKATLRDIAATLQVYLQPMVVESHIAVEEPYAYWLEVAINRSLYVISVLEEYGVPRGLLVPGGELGLEEKVVVYCFDREEQEAKRMKHRHHPRPRPPPPEDTGKKGKGKK